jgi:hypothetical protein
MKTFLIEDVFHLTPVVTTNFRKKYEMALMVLSGADPRRTLN